MGYMTTKQIADAIGVSLQRVRALARSRNISCAAVAGNALLWNREDLPRFTRQQTGRPHGRKTGGTPLPPVRIARRQRGAA